MPQGEIRPMGLDTRKKRTEGKAGFALGRREQGRNTLIATNNIFGNHTIDEIFVHM